MVLALNYLQGYYASEIARSQQKLSNYRLHSEFSSSLAMTLFLPDCEVYSPTELVHKSSFASLIAVYKQHFFSDVDTSSDTSASNSVLHNLSQKEQAKHVTE